MSSGTATLLLVTRLDFAGQSNNAHTKSNTADRFPISLLMATYTVVDALTLVHLRVHFIKQNCFKKIFDFCRDPSFSCCFPASGFI